MIDVLRNTVMITGFVFVMMLVIEYVNVLTSGAWQQKLAGSRFGQYILAAFLGAVPGCLGSFAVVAMYTHRVVTVGAVVATMVATSGDEAFVMLAMIPKQAVILTGILFAAGIVAGMVTDLFLARSKFAARLECGGMVLHDEHAEEYLNGKRVVSRWKSCKAPRGILAIVLALLIAGIATGQIGHHDHGAHGESSAGEAAAPESGHEHDAAPEEGGWDWVRVSMLLVSLLALFIVVTVSDHFLEEHLWEHIAKRHLPRIFLWTLGAMVVLYLISERLDVDLRGVAGGRPWLFLVLACLVGIIPESGPHLIFVTLFAQGAIPFSVLLANSIVQDGHGMLPMLAYSRKGFVLVKAINLLAGFLLGAAAYMAGF
ncbi:MAG: arsenic efflux protein [Candidatus Krumholzibacteria bacterium]|jgi:hypothetical protein|nr:arsenic efflux protein [Candidatus Krumholzibacteria bacterium]